MESVVVSGEQIVIAEAVRLYSEGMLPGDAAAAGAGVAAALGAYRSGASPAAAYEAGRRLTSSWKHHPSRP